MSLMETLSELDDPRRPSIGTHHDCREIRVIEVRAARSEADGFEDIALCGRRAIGRKRPLPRRARRAAPRPRSIRRPVGYGLHSGVADRSSAA